MIASRKALILVASLLAAALVLPWGGAVGSASAQTISVTSAKPASAEQGTQDLNVTITGKGFKSGAKASFYKTKTLDPAGVAVNSTQYVSSTQLVANISVGDAAALDFFDIVVNLTDGRTGKGTELFKVLAKKTPPPPQTFELSDGFNIVKLDWTSMSSGTARYTAWNENPTTGVYTLGWTETAPNMSRYVFGDYDGDGLNELVVVAGCSAPEGVYLFLKAYRNGTAGPAYVGDCRTESFLAPESLTYNDVILAADVDMDNQDELILATGGHLAVFDWDQSATPPRMVVTSVDLVALGLAPAGLAFTRRGVAVGDADNDTAVEIVCAVSYRNDAQQDKEYLLIFKPDLTLKAAPYPLHQVTDPDLSDFSIDWNTGIQIADTDGDLRNEVWMAGWTNDFTLRTYHQRILSYTVALAGGEVLLTPGASIDLGVVQNLGPKISVGKFSGETLDQIVAWRLDGDAYVRVYANDGTPQLSQRFELVYADPFRVTLDGHLFVYGYLPAEKRVAKGWLLEVLAPASDGKTLTSLWQTSARDGYEPTDAVVGRGRK